MFGARTPKEELDVLRNEYDPRSPKLRVMILSYLTDRGAKPTIKELTDTLNWVVEEREGFLEAVAESLPEPVTSAEEMTEAEVKDAYDIMKGSYL